VDEYDPGREIVCIVSRKREIVLHVLAAEVASRAERQAVQQLTQVDPRSGEHALRVGDIITPPGGGSPKICLFRRNGIVTVIDTSLLTVVPPRESKTIDSSETGVARRDY
jgi:hypothetical protein